MVQSVDLNELAALQGAYPMQPVAVYIPSMYEGGCDQYCCRPHKNHTLLVSTIVGLLAAGGAFYACKNKNSQALLKEVKEWGAKAYKDFKEIWNDKIASKINPKS